MQCPKCKLELFIDKTRYVVEDDNTEEKKTKLFYEQDLVCRNTNCSEFGKVVDTSRSEIPI